MAPPRALGQGSLGLTALSPLPREPDSTYFDLPQSSRGSREVVGGTEASMDVFHLQGMTTSVMVSGAAVCGGLRVEAVNVDCPVLGLHRTRNRVSDVQLPLWVLSGHFKLQSRKCIGSWIQASLDPGIGRPLGMAGSRCSSGCLSVFCPAFPMVALS